jgi:protoporphyrinogen oxidase
MTTNYYDIIIIGSGMAGLFSAYNIKKISQNTSFLILEKYKKQWIGGRTSNEMFYGTQIVTGAGVGRKDKDKVLIKLMDEIGLKYSQYKLCNNFYSC